MPRPILTRRLAIIFATGVALIALLPGCFHYYFLYRPIGEGPAGPLIARERFSEPWSQRTVLLLGLGDSITAGLGANTPDHSFFNRLLRNPKDEYADMQGCSLSAVLPKLESKNLAVSGSTSLHHWETVQLKLATPANASVFGIVVMTSGGNDLIHNYGQTPPKEGAMYGATLAQAQPWIKNYEERLERIFTGIDAHFPGGCEIFIGDIYDPTDGVGDAPSVYLPHWPDGLAIHAEYNRVIRAVAKQRKNVHVVPLHATFLGHGSHCRQFWRGTYRADDPHYWYFSNIEDPNDRGYDAIRRVFLQSIIDHSQLVPNANRSSEIPN